MSLPIIYFFYDEAKDGQNYGQAYAIAEDGGALGSHTCSDISFARGDIGFYPEMRKDRQEIYNDYYPQGFERVWVDQKDVDGHKELQTAIKLNHVVERFKK